MSRQPGRDVLFDPIRIGPVTARNRFYQVPHCTGLGHAHPQAEAALRGVKAAGGWAVVCSQETEIHPSSETSPYREGRLWDAADVPAHRLMTDAVHAHGSLAGIQLVHNGQHAPNLTSRVPPMGPGARPVNGIYPVQSRAMDRRDIRELRRWYVQAARRARQAGYDIVYVYAGHDMCTLMHFLLPRYNDRVDDYGGSLTNRLRLLVETLSDVRDAVGGDCAVALRLAVDELAGPDGLQAEGEGAEIVSRLAALPDLWDVNLSGWENDSVSARFEPVEGYQSARTAFVKSLVPVPVVGVGRFTSASLMRAMIERGLLDFIGAARPSIADPFLPNKIREGREAEIRECIGCNICVASDNTVAPIRCTQNPTMGEEWRSGWHPEGALLSGAPALLPKGKVAGGAAVLVIGAGPAGLECALQLSRQGSDVLLAEATRDTGGRLLGESRLPGLSSYRRVRDYRHAALRASPRVQLLLDNPLTASEVSGADVSHIMVATGARWRTDFRGRAHPEGLSLPAACVPVRAPESVMQKTVPGRQVVVYDDDHYYLGGVLAECLRRAGKEVTLVTPADTVSAFTVHTLEHARIRRRLLEIGVRLVTSHTLADLGAGAVRLICSYSGRSQWLAADGVIPVTSRQPSETLYRELEAAALTPELRAIGDCQAPSTVAAAVYSGHRAARAMLQDEERLLFRR